MKKLLIIDGNSILNRAFYGIRPLSTKSGLPTNALYGFARMLKKHLDTVHPEYAACAFDLHAPTFRHKLSEAYKATRKGMPEDLALQFPYAHRLAEALGFTVVELEGYEADDVIGTLAKKAEDSGVHTYILTGDRDSLQLLSDSVSVILTKTKEDILYTPERFNAEYGISPSQFVDVKALMGDSSDNIPGVAGIGEKTALKLISSVSSLDALYSDISACGASAGICAKLEAGRDSAFLSRTLAQICRSVPGIDSIDFTLSEGTDKKALSALFDELEFTGMRAAFSLSDSDRETEPETQSVPDTLPVTPAELISAVGDTAFIDVSLENGIMHISAANESGVYSASGDAADFAPLFSKKIICHDAKKLYSVLAPSGISANVEFDVMLAAYLLNPGDGSYPTGRIAAHFDPSLPNTAPDAWLIYKLYPILADKLEAEGMTKLLHEIEIPLSAVLSEMERDGIMLDTAGLRTFAAQLAEHEASLSDAIYERVGFRFNLNSPKQLGEVLFENLGLPHGKKTKTGYSTNAETLEKLRPYDPVIGTVLEYREISKLRSTYGEALAAQADGNSRIHTRFNQCGTATGRLSSTDPNMQNIPVRGELGRELRRYFKAPDGRLLIDADYSQIELRLLASISGDRAMCDAFNSGADIHTSTAAEVFRVPPELVTHELRSRAKAVNFGIVYGIGEYSLSQDLGISRHEAAEYIANYLNTYPGVAEYLRTTVENAKRDGFTVTMFSRKRYIPELSSRNKNVRAFGERVAKNSPIQGSAADIIKIAMIDVSRALRESGLDARLILQVHDELIVECAERDAERASAILKESMENAAETAVRLCAEVSTGRNWLEAKD